MSRNNHAYSIFKDLITSTCHLRNDELLLIMSCIFRHLNRDDEDDGPNATQTLKQHAIKVSITLAVAFGHDRSLSTAVFLSLEILRVLVLAH